MTKNEKPYSFKRFTHAINTHFAVLFICLIVFIGGFIGGSLWTENKTMKSGIKAQVGAQVLPTDPSQQVAPPSGPTVDQLNTVAAITDEDHVRGNRDAEIVLIEYSDFECPFCQRFHPTMKDLLAEYGDDIAWVYRHYPLPFHQNAQKAAEASECVAQVAGEEAYWEFNDLYFETTDGSGTGVSVEEMSDLAAQVGANKAEVASCIESGEMTEKVTAQLEAGSAAGVSGTPGTIIVVNGEAKELIPGALPLEDIKVMIESYR